MSQTAAATIRTHPRIWMRTWTAQTVTNRIPRIRATIAPIVLMILSNHWEIQLYHKYIDRLKEKVYDVGECRKRSEE